MDYHKLEKYYNNLNDRLKYGYYILMLISNNGFNNWRKYLPKISYDDFKYNNSY